MPKSAEAITKLMEDLGAWVVAPPGKPEKPVKSDFIKGSPQLEEVAWEMAREWYIFEASKYQVKILFSIETAFFRYPAKSKQRKVLLDYEKFQRNFVSKLIIGKCRVLPGEDALQAKKRSLDEALKAFPYTILNYGDWYREMYLHSEHWLRLRKDILSTTDGACSECGKKGQVPQVHHEEYRNIFDVTINDLICLCSSCHKAVHGIEQTV